MVWAGVLNGGFGVLDGGIEGRAAGRVDRGLPSGGSLFFRVRRPSRAACAPDFGPDRVAPRLAHVGEARADLVGTEIVGSGLVSAALFARVTGPLQPGNSASLYVASRRRDIRLGAHWKDERREECQARIPHGRPFGSHGRSVGDASMRRCFTGKRTDRPRGARFPLKHLSSLMRGCDRRLPRGPERPK